ncbi:hypothetical protein BAUCODRAFT_121053 [Baudoinia panamericana UAMH 10762]|uniref:Uncharacterized protein n=1 Tax=Baudoinia panamericana (strain UAMH 10762) TaxID=717646 RepID=M2NGN2_BAUPA|nr:uncharacterized protein BAUCODRAFT_121053 [Baudoinia panamericana UAMH 10762]EMC98160.1 hypothetical protein BAUCODRAFT_121053 [Baudoinia panamericana UAMH 10762]
MDGSTHPDLSALALPRSDSSTLSDVPMTPLNPSPEIERPDSVGSNIFVAPRRHARSESSLSDPVESALSDCSSDKREDPSSAVGYRVDDERSSLTPAPAVTAVQRTRTSVAASSSVLSSLDSTPEPPSPLRVAFAHLERAVECTCEGWCTCPKHAAWPLQSPKHLPESALMSASDDAPVSAVRETLIREWRRRKVLEAGGGSLAESAKKVHETLVELAVATGKGENASPNAPSPAQAASMLTDHIHAVFPVHFRRKPVLDRVHDALCHWRSTREADGATKQLWHSFGDAVEGHPDLLLVFAEYFMSEARPEELHRKRERWLQPFDQAHDVKAEVGITVKQEGMNMEYL